MKKFIAGLMLMIAATVAHAQVWEADHELMKAMHKSGSQVIEGKGPRHVYAFVDPYCRWSKQLVRDTKAIAKSGQVTIHWLITPVLQGTDESVSRVLSGAASDAFRETMEGQHIPPEEFSVPACSASRGSVCDNVDLYWAAQAKYGFKKGVPRIVYEGSDGKVYITHYQKDLREVFLGK